jgi:hypothetical protein
MADLSDIICACPVFNRLDIAKISILSLCDLGLNVIGVSDGEVEFDLKHEKFSYIQKEKSGVVGNVFCRLRELIKLNKKFIYLFDSDTVHLPSCVERFTLLKEILKDNSIISLYQGPLYNSVEETEHLYRLSNLSGISLFFNQDTAIKCLRLEKEWSSKSSGVVGKTDWDVFVTNNFNCYCTKNSYVQHLGKDSGINRDIRAQNNLIDEAKNINVDELNETMLKYQNV